MIRLSADRAVEVGPYAATKPLKSTGRANSGNLPHGTEWTHRSLASFRVKPYGTVYVNFYTVDMYDYRGPPLRFNKHVPGCLGDVYLIGHFEATECGMSWDPETVGAEDFEEGADIPAWLMWDLDETHGLLPSFGGWWIHIAGELRFKSLYYYNRFLDYVVSVENKLFRTVKTCAPELYSLFQRDAIQLIKTFKHPESEFCHTSASSLHPEGIPLQLFRSANACETYLKQFFRVADKYLCVNIVTEDIRLDLGNLRKQFKVDCPTMDRAEYSQSVGGVWAAMVMRTRKTVAQEEAESTAAQRAMAEADEKEHRRRLEIHDAMMEAERAEAKAKELRRKLQASESRKLAAERGPRALTAYREPPKSKKAGKVQDRKTKRMGTKEEATINELAHGVHVLPEQHEIREDAFNLRQQIEKAEAEARRAREKMERFRKLGADASAAHEAVVHVVPPIATLNEALVAAIDARESVPREGV